MIILGSKDGFEDSFPRFVVEACSRRYFTAGESKYPLIHLPSDIFLNVSDTVFCLKLYFGSIMARMFFLKSCDRSCKAGCNITGAVVLG